MLSLVSHVIHRPFVRKWVRKNGSGDNRDDWVTYLVGVGVVHDPDPFVQRSSDSFPWRRRAGNREKNRPYLQVMKKVISEERALTNPSV